MNANWINEAAIESASNQQLKFPVYYNSIYLVDCNKNSEIRNWFMKFDEGTEIKNGMREFKTRLIDWIKNYKIYWMACIN